MVSIFSNTIYNANGEETTWEVIYNKLEDEHPKVVVTKATTHSIKPSGLQFRDATCSFLHRIGERAKILPYIDIIRWVVENLTIEDR